MKPPAFQFYAADFLVGTSTMTNEEVGIYIRLLCHQWDKGFVAKDKASRIVGAKIPADVLNKFADSNGELRNERLENERKKQSEYREQQSQRGKAGADARWNASRDGTRHASANGEVMASLSSGQCPSDRSLSSFSSSGSNSANSTSTTSVEWAALAVELEELGLGKAEATVKAAQTRGYSLERVREIIAVWRTRPELRPGAIKTRIEESTATVPADSGCWPASETAKCKSPTVDRHLERYDQILIGASPQDVLALMEQAGIPADQREGWQEVRSIRRRLWEQLHDNVVSAAATTARLQPNDSSKPQ